MDILYGIYIKECESIISQLDEYHANASSVLGGWKPKKLARISSSSNPMCDNQRDCMCSFSHMIFIMSIVTCLNNIQR